MRREKIKEKEIRVKTGKIRNRKRRFKEYDRKDREGKGSKEAKNESNTKGRRADGRKEKEIRK